MRKILILTVLVLTTLACTFTINAGGTPQQDPNEFAVITYVYVPNSQGGVDISFLAEQSIPNPSFTFEGGKSPTIEGIKSSDSDSPLVDLKIELKDKSSSQTTSGITDSTGHLDLSVSFTNGAIFIDSAWTCSEVTNWQSLDQNNVVKDGGAIWTCSRFVPSIDTVQG